MCETCVLYSYYVIFHHPEIKEVCVWCLCVGYGVCGVCLCRVWFVCVVCMCVVFVCVVCLGGWVRVCLFVGCVCGWCVCAWCGCAVCV